uniref:Uncharacterized protein n=1 Tax=Oryza nivara TaxID=4536 RepID=A0A0E0GFC1_ORYNI
MRVLLSRLVSKRWPSGALSKRCISQPHGCSLLVAWFCQLYRVLVVVVVVTTAGLALTACSTFRKLQNTGDSEILLKIEL